MPRRDPKKLARSRELRANMSEPEWALWRILRAHRLEGIKFTRQVECGGYHIDFAARMLQLGFELDGETHDGREQKDEARTAFLERNGWRIIRFTNAEVLGNAEGVARAILNALGKDFEG
jgi:very-short-patch-repair endonuclease